MITSAKAVAVQNSYMYSVAVVPLFRTRVAFDFLACFHIPKVFQGDGSVVVSVSCFGVRVSVMFHFMFVHYTFS